MGVRICLYINPGRSQEELVTKCVCGVEATGVVAGNLLCTSVYLTDFAKTVSIETFRKKVNTLTVTVAADSEGGPV